MLKTPYEPMHPNARNQGYDRPPRLKAKWARRATTIKARWSIS